MSRSVSSSHNPDVVHEAERRATRSTSLPLALSLISEVIAAIPSAKVVNVWLRKKRHALYEFAASNLNPVELEASERALDRSARALIGLRVIQKRETRLLSREGRRRHRKPISGKDLMSCPVLRANKRTWATTLSFGKRTSYLIEVYSSAEPAGDAGLSRLLQHYVAAYDRAAGVLEQSHPERADSISSTHEHVSLAAIQDRVFQAVRARAKQFDDSQVHLFLLNPEDACLYYASTDQLKIDPACGSPLVLPKNLLRDDQIDHIRKRIRQHAVGHGMHDKLERLFDELMDRGLDLPASTKKVALLRELLRCFPQESATGVAGDAVNSRVLAVAGRSRGRWDEATLNYHCFLFKLRVEQAFGIAKHGQLAAAPVFDGPQVVGTILVTAPRITPHLGRALLDASIEAGEILSSYRQGRFLHSVIHSLKSDHNQDALVVIAENLAKIISHRLLVLVRSDGEGQRAIERAWYRHPGEIDFREAKDRNAMTSDPSFHEFLRHVTAQPPMIPMSLPDALISGSFMKNIHTPEVPGPLSALTLSVDSTTSYVLLLDEDVQSIRLALPAFQHKAVLVASLAVLPESFRKRVEYVDSVRSTLARTHHFEKRHVFPLRTLSRIVGRISEMSGFSAEAFQELRRVSESLGLRAKLLEHFAESIRDAGEASPTAKGFSLKAAIEDELRVLVFPTLRRQEQEVKLETVFSGEEVFIQADLYEFLTTLADLIDNSVKHLPDVECVQMNPERGLIRVEARATERGVRITVIDQGKGMPRPQVFLEQRRLDAVADGANVGGHFSENGRRITIEHTGLVNAAYFARKFRTQSAEVGRVRVHSTQGAGTEIELSLPTLRAVAE